MVQSTAFQAPTVHYFRCFSATVQGGRGLVCSSTAKKFLQGVSLWSGRNTGARRTGSFLTRRLALGSQRSCRSRQFQLDAAFDGMVHKKALVAVANGSEEIETVTAVDTLVRAGVQVTLASVENERQVTASRGVKLVADALITDSQVHSAVFDAVILPGGMPGAEHLRDSQPLVELLKRHIANGQLIGAICAAPAVALASHRLLDGVKATCYPAPNFRAKLMTHAHMDEAVVRDGQFITSQGPGTALAFSLAMVEALCGSEQAEKVAKAMLTPMPMVTRR
ncbi:hypothetical protein CCYA_CCYA17G4442 [Cyanidiococcus yangmingshanensis]|nr:hypothetical protein CCYA_CCYA17G4442 [Cyanidiococcus yangmingshanensis]